MKTNRTRNGLTIAVLLAATVAFAGFPAVLADQVVYFQNGKAIMVKSIEKGDTLTILEMDGGGKIGVPTAQIVRIEDYLITATGGIQAAPVAAAPPVNVPAQANAVTPPVNRATGTGFDGAPLAAGPGSNIPAPLPVVSQGQGPQTDRPIRPRYPMSPLQGLARGGAEGRGEMPVAAGPGAGRQMTPFGLRHGRGIEGRVPPGNYAQPLGAIQAAQAQAAQMRSARPQAPPAPTPPSEPTYDAAEKVDPSAAPDDVAGDSENDDADTPDDESSVEN